MFSPSLYVDEALTDNPWAESMPSEYTLSEESLFTPLTNGFRPNVNWTQNQKSTGLLVVSSAVKLFLSLGRRVLSWH